LIETWIKKPVGTRHDALSPMIANAIREARAAALEEAAEFFEARARNLSFDPTSAHNLKLVASTLRGFKEPAPTTTPKTVTWGEAYNRARAKGYDHGYAAYLADKADPQEPACPSPAEEERTG
jgi:hypothetical protein